MNISTDDMISGLDIRLVQLPGTLQRAGIAVPEPLTAGLAVARWRLPSVDTTAAESAVLSATTEDEYHDALLALADARLKAEAVKAPAVRGVSDRARTGPVHDAFRDIYPTTMAAIIERYNDCVPGFRTELASLPDLRGKGAYDLTALDTAALAAVRTSADTLTALLDAYRSMARLANEPNTGSMNSVTGAMSLLSIIAEFSSGNALESAATDLTRYSDGEGLHGPLQPHAVAVWQAETVRMVMPDEAAERREAAQSNWRGTDAA